MKKLALLGITALSIAAFTPLSAKAAVNIQPIIIGSNGTIEQIKERLESGSIRGNRKDFSWGTVIWGSNCPNINLPGNNQTKPEEKPNQKPDQSLPEEDTSTSSSYEQEVIRLVNKERAKAGLSALKLDQTVAKAAFTRAKEIEKSFSHTRPNGQRFHTVLTENGVRYTSAGENIAWGQKTPEQVVKAWMNSPSHRANIMNKSYTTIGVGHYKNSSGTSYWVQLFTR